MKTRRLLWLLTSLALLSVHRCDGADPRFAQHAVVMVPSHGGSAVCIASGPGRSVFLSAAHMFGPRDRGKRIVIDAPAPTTGAPRQVGSRVLAVDARSDLALFEVYAGPLPYVAPVAPAGFPIPRRLLSVGYDELALPPQVRPTTFLDQNETTLRTRERPWHGRSGGALLDPQTGYLVGVVSGYVGPRNHRELHPGAWGVYASHRAIVRFLAQANRGPQPPPMFAPQTFAPRGCLPGG